jgi:hypothetical protein
VSAKFRSIFDGWRGLCVWSLSLAPLCAFGGYSLGEQGAQDEMNQIVANVGAVDVRVADVISYALIRGGLTDGLIRDEVSAWLTANGYRPAGSHRGRDSALIDLIEYLQMIQYDWAPRPFPSNGLVELFQRSDLQVVLVSQTETLKAPALVLVSDKHRREAVIHGWSDLSEAERCLRFLEGVRKGVLLSDGLSLEGALRCVWVASWVMGEMVDEFARLHLRTWLDHLDPDGPLIYLDFSGAWSWCTLKEEREIASNSGGSTGATAAFYLAESGSVPGLLAKYGPSTRNYERNLNELLWILSAREVNAGFADEPSSGAREWFSLGTAFYNPRWPWRWLGTTTSEYGAPSDFVMLSVMEAYMSAEASLAGRHPATREEPLLRAHADSKFVFVDAAAFIDSDGDREESLARARKFVDMLPEEPIARREQFREVERSAELYLADESIRYEDVFGSVVPAWLRPEEIYESFVEPDSPSKLPYFWNHEGAFGADDRFVSIVAARNGGVVGPFRFAIGWVVVDVVHGSDVGNLRPDPAEVRPTGRRVDAIPLPVSYESVVAFSELVASWQSRYIRRQ